MIIILYASTESYVIRWIIYQASDWFNNSYYIFFLDELKKDVLSVTDAVLGCIVTGTCYLMNLLLSNMFLFTLQGTYIVKALRASAGTEPSGTLTDEEGLQRTYCINVHRIAAQLPYLCCLSISLRPN